MRDPRRQRFAPYIRDLADRMELRDWRLAVSDYGPSNPAHNASITIANGKKYALIELSDNFLDTAPPEQRKSCVHELVHCHVEAAWEVAAGELPPAVRGAFARLMEYAVDGLADAQAPHMPLPPAEGPPPPAKSKGRRAR